MRAAMRARYSRGAPSPPPYNPGSIAGPGSVRASHSARTRITHRWLRVGDLRINVGWQVRDAAHVRTVGEKNVAMLAPVFTPATKVVFVEAIA